MNDSVAFMEMMVTAYKTERLLDAKMPNGRHLRDCTAADVLLTAVG
jgi:hypothetical protein